MRFVVALALIVLVGSSGAGAKPEPSRAEAMATAAAAFLGSLTKAQRERAALAFGHPMRRRWQATPGRRVGLTLGALSKAQRRLADALLRTGLSESGMRKLNGVVQLERILYRRQTWRDPGLYWIAVYGAPSAKATWSWRIEGHHYSRHFTCVSGTVSATPSFHGANPARAGERDQGLRVLAAEEDVARELLASLDAKRRGRAVLTVPARDFLPSAPRELARLPAQGLPAKEMTEAQRAILWRVIRVWAAALHPTLAEAELARARRSKPGEIRFAWMGSAARGRAHGYRIRGSTFLLEYWQGRNHIHTVWRDPGNEFGAADRRRAKGPRKPSRGGAGGGG